MMMFSSKCCYLSSSVLIFLVVFSNVLCISQSLRKCPSVKRHGSFCFSYPQFGNNEEVARSIFIYCYELLTDSRFDRYCLKISSLCN